MNALKFDRRKYNDDVLIHLYKGLLKPRMIEEKMLLLLRMGKISKWFSGIGQEAISVGLTLAMNDDEYILPMHRNLGVFTCRNVELGQLFAQFQGKYKGFSKGRERSFHFGSKPHHIVGMISHLGPQNGIADGIALGNLLKDNKKITAVFNGDGGTSQGDFHESLNVAAVWDLPVIFVIENNGYGLSTPSSEQFRCKYFIDKAIGYGMEAYQVDGNNIIDVFDTVKKICEDLKHKPRPVILECLTFRMRGHEEASGTKYVPKELFEMWGKKDPLTNFENYLKEQGILNDEKIEAYRATYKKEIEDGLDYAFNLPEIEADTEYELSDIYAPTNFSNTEAGSNTSEKRLVDAISDGLSQAMDKHSNLVLMGQDIAEYGGVFKITEGFVEKYGKKRVRNTPLCESAILGSALGLSINGYKAMVEMQFADFVTCGFNQITNNLAKSHYRWGQNADVVVRMPTGAGVAAGPFHSQSNEAWFFHTPGLKILYPAFPADAKGLLISAFEDPNPIMFFEHKALYRSINGNVPEGYYTTPIGKAAKVKEGNDVSIITYGFGVHWALDYLNKNSHISADLIDLRTLLPFDEEAIIETVKKTGRAIILHEDTLVGGIGGEISAFITEHCFEYLDAPVKRVASLDTPVPCNTVLEWNFLPKKRFEKELENLLKY